MQQEPQNITQKRYKGSMSVVDEVVNDITIDDCYEMTSEINPGESASGHAWEALWDTLLCCSY